MKDDRVTLNYLMDTSSLFTLFFSDSEDRVKTIMSESFILDLTGYEIGSILTKGNDGHIKGLNLENLRGLTREIEKIIGKIRVIRFSPEHISEIMAFSISTGLTFYDASYVFYSKHLGLALLTDVSEMYGNAKKMKIEVRKAEDLLN